MSEHLPGSLTYDHVVRAAYAQSDTGGGAGWRWVVDPKAYEACRLLTDVGGRRIFELPDLSRCFSSGVSACFDSHLLEWTAEGVTQRVPAALFLFGSLLVVDLKADPGTLVLERCR